MMRGSIPKVVHVQKKNHSLTESVAAPDPSAGRRKAAAPAHSLTDAGTIASHAESVGSNLH